MSHATPRFVLPSLLLCAVSLVACAGARASQGPAPQPATPGQARAEQPPAPIDQKQDPVAPAAGKPSKNPTCNEPIQPTPCMTMIRSVRYDATQGTCVETERSGCGMAASDFPSMEACRRACL